MMTDVELVSAARGGSEHAFRRLYRQYARAVYWIAHGLLSDESDAEEVTQETFVVAWRKLETFELQGESLLPWLATICRFQAANRMRLRRKERAHAGPVADETIPDTISVEDQVIGADLATAISRTVLTMGELDREIFQLVAVDGYGYQAAADELNIGHGVVRNRLSRIRSRLRSTMTETERS